MENKTSGISVAVVYQSRIDELIHRFTELAFLKNLYVPEYDEHRWDMNLNDGHEEGYCIQAIFIGKTGYGKSTTLNKICGQELFKTAFEKSCTKTLFSAEYKIHSKKNYYFSLCDLPGIAETDEADKTYVDYYYKMLFKSHCVVYVLRADKREYSRDQEILKPILEEDGQREKIIFAVNYADKIEPISRSMPFSPNKQQWENIREKTLEIEKIFNIPQRSIVFYSADTEYCLKRLVKRIAVNLLLTERKELLGLLPLLLGTSTIMDGAISLETFENNLDKRLDDFIANWRRIIPKKRK
jgi:small GTP-binding protein